MIKLKKNYSFDEEEYDTKLSATECPIETATIFIDSTLNDMYAERDLLVKEVIPEVRKWCFKHNIRLNIVDLRWDITEEYSMIKDIIDINLCYIDKCRPFYICFLGQHRGWIPNLECDISEKTIRDYPDIYGFNGLSLTEMNINHALLTPMYRIIEKEGKKECPPTKHSLFFFRDDSFLNQLSSAQKEIYTNKADADEENANKKLEKIKEDIRQRKFDEDKENKNRSDVDKVHIGITKYKGIWDRTKEIPELSHLGKKVSMGKLINFKCGDCSLKDELIIQIEEQLALAFPTNIEPLGCFKEPLTIEVKNIGLNDIYEEKKTTKRKTTEIE